MSAASAPEGVLFDTCAVIWLANGDRLRREALDTILHAGLHDGIFISPVSAWEIGLLGRRQSGATTFLPDAKTWFARVMSGPAIRPAPFTSDIAIDASSLSEPLNADPADRLLIATARTLGVPLVTRDRKIEVYGPLGHLGMILC